MGSVKKISIAERDFDGLRTVMERWVICWKDGWLRSERSSRRSMGRCSERSRGGAAVGVKGESKERSKARARWRCSRWGKRAARRGIWVSIWMEATQIESCESSIVY